MSLCRKLTWYRDVAMIVVVRYGIQPRMVVIVSYDALHEAVALTHPLFSIGPPAFQIVLACSRAFSALYHDVYNAWMNTFS